MPVRRVSRYIAAGALLLGARARVTGNQALHPVTAVSYSLAVPQWPRDFHISFALLSDIHMGVGMNAPRLEEIVTAVNLLGCDVIGVLGDMIDGAYSHRHFEHDWSHALSKLSAPVAVAGVPGNHDYKGDIAKVHALFKKANIPLLQNTALQLEKDGRSFWLAGIDSQWGAPVKMGHIRKGHHDIDKTLAAITDDAPAVLLMHEPDIFPRLPERFAVAFAGHTHGGQINLPYIGRPLVRAFPGRFKSDQVYGHFVSEDGRRQMIITSGVGCSGLPLRWGVPPEIVKVELRGEA